MRRPLPHPESDGNFSRAVGLRAELHGDRGEDAEAEYRREVDPFTDYYVSERAALSVQARLFVGRLEAEVARVRAVWSRTLAPAELVEA